MMRPREDKVCEAELLDIMKPLEFLRLYDIEEHASQRYASMHSVVHNLLFRHADTINLSSS